MKFVFFGTPNISVITLQSLKNLGLIPEIIVTTPDKPAGRGMKLSSSPVKEYAISNNIPHFEPEKITTEVTQMLLDLGPWDFYLVFAYGKIIPNHLLESINHKVVNIHPSLLPKLRGPSPLQSVLLTDNVETGVTLMKIDNEIDHGDIIAQEKINLNKNITIKELSNESAILGAKMVAQYIPKFVSGELKAIPQNDEEATYCKKIEKEEALLTEKMTDWEKWKKYRAFIFGPTVFFEDIVRGKKIKVKIVKATFAKEKFNILEVIPQNHKLITFEEYKKWRI